MTNLQDILLKASNYIRLMGSTGDGYYMVRDFMAQKFTKAYLKSESEDELKRLQELWKDLTGEFNEP